MTAFNSPALPAARRRLQLLQEGQGNEEQILRALEAIFGVVMTKN
jgi:hypothetical protein